jgi:hypothetical protein
MLESDVRVQVPGRARTHSNSSALDTSAIVSDECGGHCQVEAAGGTVEGDARAQVNLGLMYDDGEGVLQDYVEAHMWFNLAVAQFSGEERASIGVVQMLWELHPVWEVRVP